jgi:hypothetical protein
MCPGKCLDRSMDHVLDTSFCSLSSSLLSIDTVQCQLLTASLNYEDKRLAAELTWRRGFKPSIQHEEMYADGTIIRFLRLLFMRRRGIVKKLGMMIVPRGTLYSLKVGNHFADKRRSLGRYSSLEDSDHGV